MIVNLSEITKCKNFKKEVHMCYERKPIYFDGDKIQFSKPINADGTISLMDDMVEVKLKVSTELILPCSRCLELFNYPLEFEVNENISTVDTEDDGISVIEGDDINVTEILENSIIMALPTKILCKEDCKGLCQQCGANLNDTSCTCNNDDVDIRFSNLKDLFFTE